MMRTVALRATSDGLMARYEASRDVVLDRLVATASSRKRVAQPSEHVHPGESKLATARRSSQPAGGHLGPVSPPSGRGVPATPGAHRGVADKAAVSIRPTSVRASSNSGPLYDVAGELPSDAFVECWHAAVQYLNSMVQDGIKTWLKGAPTPPFREHLSFRLGNQLFLIRIEDVSGRLVGPGTRDGLVAAATSLGGWPCIMPMTKGRDGDWKPAKLGWGLVHARNGQPIDPFVLVSDEEIEMTDGELHHFAVQIVEQQLVSAGAKVNASQGDLGLDPSIWIKGESGPEWVVVRAARYPKQRADIPMHWDSIVERCRNISVRGHFASVAVARADANFENDDPSPGKLLRGHGMYVRYLGLEQISALRQI